MTVPVGDAGHALVYLASTPQQGSAWKCQCEYEPANPGSTEADMKLLHGAHVDRVRSGREHASAYPYRTSAGMRVRCVCGEDLGPFHDEASLEAEHLFHEARSAVQ